MSIFDDNTAANTGSQGDHHRGLGAFCRANDCFAPCGSVCIVFNMEFLCGEALAKQAKNGESEEIKIVCANNASGFVIHNAGGCDAERVALALGNAKLFAKSLAEHGNIFNREPLRVRRLLMHKREIRKLFALVKQDGYALIPLSVYLKGSRVKVKVGLCKGKKLYDKRQSAAEKDAKRQIERAMKERY